MLVSKVAIINMKGRTDDFDRFGWRCTTVLVLRNFYKLFIQIGCLWSSNLGPHRRRRKRSDSWTRSRRDAPCLPETREHRRKRKKGGCDNCVVSHLCGDHRWTNWVVQGPEDPVTRDLSQWHLSQTVKAGILDDEKNRKNKKQDAEDICSAVCKFGRLMFESLMCCVYQPR